jgi:hypothetical protein
MDMSTDHPTKSRVDPSICTVEHLCGSGGGAAVYIYETGECWVVCSGSFRSKVPAGRLRLSLEARVSVEAKDFERARLGEVLAKYCEAELYIPAAAASESVTLTMRDTTLGAAIERAGLVIGHTGVSGKSSMK